VNAPSATLDMFREILRMVICRLPLTLNTHLIVCLQNDYVMSAGLLCKWILILILCCMYVIYIYIYIYTDIMPQRVTYMNGHKTSVSVSNEI